MTYRAAGGIIVSVGSRHHESDIRLGQFHAPFDESREHIVIVEIDVHELSLGGQNTLKPAEVHAIIYFATQVADAVSVESGNGWGIVRAAMVDDDDLADLSLG